jgi:hypothetical protein
MISQIAKPAAVAAAENLMHCASAVFDSSFSGNVKREFKEEKEGKKGDDPWNRLIKCMAIDRYSYDAVISGFKVLDCNFQGLGGFQYNLGEMHNDTHFSGKSLPRVQKRGLHFLVNPLDFNDRNSTRRKKPYRYVAVTAFGPVDTVDGVLWCTNKLIIEKEFSLQEWNRLRTGYVLKDDGSKTFYTEGKLGRHTVSGWPETLPVEKWLDGPTKIYTDGKKQWLDLWGRLHRDKDLPAVVEGNGTEHWFINGVRGRSGDKPAIVRVYGDSMWMYKGMLHRVGGPAVVECDERHCEWWVVDNLVAVVCSLPSSCPKCRTTPKSKIRKTSAVVECGGKRCD